MAANYYDWSIVAANNSNSDTDLTWAEGQAPSTVNNSARVMMQRTKQLLVDLGGSIAAAGTANGLTVTANAAFTAYADGMIISFRATADNSAAATLSVNGIGAKAIRKFNGAGEAALVGGEIRNTGIYIVQYSAALNGAAGAWLLVSPTFNGQLVFPAVQSASADANTLDDYEEGVWTPTLITDATQFTSVTYDANVAGIYTKIGNLVYVAGYMETDAITVGPATGSMKIGGFPFTSRTSSPQGCMAIGAASAWNAQAPLHMVMQSNTTTALLYFRSVVTGGASNLNVTVAGCNIGANSNRLQFGGCYFV